MKRQAGTVYKFNSAEQPVYDVWGRLVLISGPHTLVKEKDTLMDKIHGRSWYILDGSLLVDVGRGSYVEERCMYEEQGGQA